MKLGRGLLVSLALLCAVLGQAQRNEVPDGQVRKKLHAKAQSAARSLRWSRVVSPQILDNTKKMLIRYTVIWEGGSIGFSPDLSPLYYTRSDPRPPGNFRNLPPLPKLSQSDAKRAQIIGRRTCETLGLGKVDSFKEVVVKRTPAGMYYPIVSVKCRLKVDSPVPVHPLSAPTVSIELEPGNLSVNRLTAPLPVRVEPWKAKEDKQTAKKAIAKFVKGQYGLDLKTESMKVDLCLIDWLEREDNPTEARRLRSIRLWLVPVYEYVNPKIGKIWFNANTMKLLGLRENETMPTSTRKNTPP